MKTLVLVWFLLPAAASLAASAVPPTGASTQEIIGRIPTEPDVVLEWNATISDHFEESSPGSTLHLPLRVYAMVHMAMFDAIVATNRDVRRASTGAIANAAATTAAHDVLVMLCPAGVNRFARLQARHFTALANDGAIAHGRQIGQRTAASILSSRAADGWPIAPFASGADAGGIDSLRMMTAKPTPFVLKHAHQFEPEAPDVELGDGVIVSNGTLRNEKFIGTPADVVPVARNIELWRTEPVVRWNRTAQTLALARPQDLPARARHFATLNTALADAFLSATYWSEIYQKGRRVPPSLWALNAYHQALDAGENAPDLAELWRSIPPRSGFPAVPAALAGAAEAVLRGTFGDALIVPPTIARGAGSEADLTSLRTIARQCAWAEFMAGASTREGCVSGYELGSRIGAYLLKQQRR